MSIILDIDQQRSTAVHIHKLSRSSLFFFLFFIFFSTTRERASERASESTYKTTRKGSLVRPTRSLVHLYRCSERLLSSSTVKKRLVLCHIFVDHFSIYTKINLHDCIPMRGKKPKHNLSIGLSHGELLCLSLFSGMHVLSYACSCSKRREVLSDSYDCVI